jgi:predicted ATP-binding protein involved in virulence
MIILIDEIEAHLHPKWQRTILPALLEIQKYLSNELEIQFFVSTHSPLVLASVETCFDEQTDRLFHLKQNYSKHNQKISEIELNCSHFKATEIL